MRSTGMRPVPGASLRGCPPASSGYNFRHQDGGGYCFQETGRGEVRHPVPTELGLQALCQTTRPGLVRAGCLYELSARVRIEGVQGRWEWFRLGICWLDAGGRFLSEARQPEDPDGHGAHDWRLLRVVARAPEGAAFAKVYLHHHFVTGTVWFDDVRLVRLPEGAFTGSRFAPRSPAPF